MMQDPLLQTRVPERVLRRVQEGAAEQGETIAAWLRRLVIKETNVKRVAAWIFHRTQSDPSVRFTPGNLPEPHYFLEPVREHSSLERVFNLYGADGQVPMPWEEWRRRDGFARPAENRFLLAGSPNEWHIATTLHNAATGIIEIALRAEPTFPSFRTFAEANARIRELGASYSRTSGDGAPSRASLELGSVHASLDVAAADRDEMVLPRLVAMLERGLGLQ